MPRNRLLLLLTVLKDWGDILIGLLLKGGVCLEQRDHWLKIQKRPKHFE